MLGMEMETKAFPFSVSVQIMNPEFPLQSPEISYSEWHGFSFQQQAGSAESLTPSQVEFV